MLYISIYLYLNKQDNYQLDGKLEGYFSISPYDSQPEGSSYDMS